MSRKIIGTVPRYSRSGIDVMYSQAAKSRGLTPQTGYGCGCDQAGGLNIKDIGHGISNAYHWAQTHHPIQKLNKFVDAVIPPNVKSFPIYQGIRNATGVLEQMGFGQMGEMMGPITYPVGRYQPILASKKRMQYKRKQNGSGKKKRKTARK